jgi:hypothetical protein
MNKILSLAEALKNLSEQGVTLDEAVQFVSECWDKKQCVWFQRIDGVEEMTMTIEQSQVEKWLVESDIKSPFCDACAELIDSAKAGCQSNPEGGCQGWDFHADFLGWPAEELEKLGQ